MSLTAHQIPLKVKQRGRRHAQTAQRWQQPSHPLHLCHFGGSSRASHRHKMSVQRIAPSAPPVISAELLQKVQQMQ